MKRYLFYISENYSFKILRPLQQEIVNRGDQVKWFIEGEHVNQKYFKVNEQRLVNIKAVNTYNPDAVFLPGNIVPSFIPGLKVHVFHGFVGGKRRKKDNTIYHFIIRGCFDLYCTHGPSSTKTFKQLAQQHQHFDVVETGFCQMDPYFYPKNDHHNKHQLSEKKPTILFSSTFSPRITQAPALLKTIERLSKNSQWQWQVTFHPKMAQHIVDGYKAIQHENLTFIETDDLIPYMENADLMLADFSSMITDFILLNKPVVTFRNPDKLPHLINVDDFNKIENAITTGLSKPKTLMEEIHRFAEITHPYRDGKSSMRVLDAVENKLQKPTNKKKKPLNLLRNFKLRKKLSYWVLK
jgi:CDP-glycerol glycerophosphotransferase (TagB/SpsB family)